MDSLDMMREADKSLVKIVHTEQTGGYEITACMTRFGGLCVLVQKLDDCGLDVEWQGDNILEARAWVKSKNKMVHGWTRHGLYSSMGFKKA